MAKKEYNIDDVVWIYGIGTGAKKGKIVKKFKLDHPKYDNNKDHYVVAVDTSIEPLFELRTWETISEDSQGPVGLIRETVEVTDGLKKLLSHGGINLMDETDTSPKKKGKR